MLRTLHAHCLKTPNVGGQHYNQYFEHLQSDIAYEDIFPASFWKHHQLKLGLNDVVRLRARDNSFDVCLTVAGKADNGELIMELWPKFPAHLAADQIAQASDAATHARTLAPSKVPLSKSDGEPMVRIEYLEVTKWRLRGFDGQEVSRNHATQTDALKAMDRYLKQMNLEMPSAEEIAEAKAVIEAAKAERLSADQAKQGKVTGKTKAA